MVDATPESAGGFPITRWSLIAAAGSGDPSQRADAALNELCQLYWKPIYSYIRGRGRTREDAEDLTQSFFVHLLENRLPCRADQQKGRFRSFLLGCLKRFLLDQQERAGAQKRGGRAERLPVDVQEVEKWLGLELDRGISPDVLYDRTYAQAQLDQALVRLRNEFCLSGRQRAFQHLGPFLQVEEESPRYGVVAKTLGTSPGTVRVMVHRMRQRYRELLRAVVAQGVDQPEAVDDELKHILAVLRG